MSRRLSSLVALAMVAAIAAGCGSETSDSGDAQAAHGRQAVKFSQCMRDNGVKEFPDPDASGELTIDAVLNGSSLDTSSTAWQNAIATCKDLRPPGFTGRKRNTQEQDRALEFAQCIRDNGVKDFPDPTPGAPLVDTRKVPSAATDSGKTVLNAAMQACRESAPGVSSP